MFDTKRYDNSTNIRYPDTIVHKNAPTVEAVRLLNEFQEAALRNIIDNGRVETNFIKDIKWWLHWDCVTDTHTAICKFNINGKDVDFKFIMPRSQPITGERIGQLIFDSIRDHVSNMIGNVLVQTCDIASVYKRI